MAKIIKFPKQKRVSVLHNEALISALKKIPADLRANIEKIITDISIEYSSVFDDMILHFPDEATQDQIESVKDVIHSHKLIISNLMTQLVEEKIRNEIARFNNV